MDKAPAQNAQVSYRYDPNDPVLSFGAESLFVSQGGVGSLRQPPCSWRKDILSFLSPVFTEDTELGGSIKVRLYVSSDAPDTAFAAKVMEVFPNGSTYNIRGSITTLAYRGHSEHRQSYTPGEIVPVDIDTWEISWMIHAGSRLRIDITSSDFPQYSIHPNKEGRGRYTKRLFLPSRQFIPERNILLLSFCRLLFTATNKIRLTWSTLNPCQAYFIVIRCTLNDRQVSAQPDSFQSSDQRAASRQRQIPTESVSTRLLYPAADCRKTCR